MVDILGTHGPETVAVNSRRLMGSSIDQSEALSLSTKERNRESARAYRRRKKFFVYMGLDQLNIIMRS